MAEDESQSALHPLLEGLGGRVRRRRNKLRLSQERLGELAGTDKGRISRLERGERVGMLSINVVAGIAHALGCRFSWLATGELPEEPIPREAVGGVFVGAGLGPEQADQLRQIAAAIEFVKNPPAKEEACEDDDAG